MLLLAPVVVLATGGVGGLFARTTNPPEVWGAGLALAARAGATVADVEFVQFHPTALAVVDGARVPLVTEALRGEGARLVDASGRPLLADVHPDGDLAPRDVAARALWRHLRAGGAAFLDARRQMARKAAFPTVRSLCLAHGIDPAAVPIPVAPAAHYHMGGVLVDADGRGDVPGLWACGEAAATGMHGANRLASNSLLEAVWGGRRVGAAIVAEPPSAIGDPSDVAFEPTEDDAYVARAVAAIAWEALGIERGHAGLSAALDRLDVLADRVQIGPARDRILVARLLATAALARTESRGAHQRADHPATDPAWRARILLTLEDEVITTAVAPLGDTGALVAGRDAVA